MLTVCVLNGDSWAFFFLSESDVLLLKKRVFEVHTCCRYPFSTCGCVWFSASAHVWCHYIFFFASVFRILCANSRICSLKQAYLLVHWASVYVCMGGRVGGVCVSCWWDFPRALCYAGQLLHPSCSDSSAAPLRVLSPHTAQHDGRYVNLRTCTSLLVRCPWLLRCVSPDTNRIR